MIYSANTISHIKNLDEVFESINIVLNNNGILIIEDPSLLECLKKNTYDAYYKTTHCLKVRCEIFESCMSSIVIQLSQEWFQTVFKSIIDENGFKRHSGT